MEKAERLTPMVVGYMVREGQVLLGLRKQTAWDMGKHLVSGIGGKIGDMPGLERETPDEALIREFQEEIGVTPTEYHEAGQVVFLFPSKPKWNQHVGIYLVEEWQGQPIETEAIRPAWYSVDHLPLDQMWHDARYYLPQLLEGRIIEATFTYGDDNKTVATKSIAVR